MRASLLYPLLYPLCLSRLMRNKQKDLAEKSSRTKNNLLDVLVCSIAEYFDELCRILMSPSTNNE